MLHTDPDPALSPEGLIRFGPFVYEPANRRLLRGTEPLPLAPQVLTLLEVLLARRGRLVTHEELRRALWPDTQVEPTAIPRVVSELRKVLGDSATNPSFVETVAKNGYRFKAEAESTVVPERRSSPGLRPRLRWAIAGGGLLMALLAAAFYLRRPDPHIGSLAVLPLRALSGTAEDRVVGWAVSDIAAGLLVPLTSAQVRPMGSVLEAVKTNGDPLAVGRRLNVDAVVDGSYWVAGGSAHVSLRVLWVRTGEVLVATQVTADAGRLDVLENRLAERIANATSQILTPHRTYTALPSKPAAHGAYLRGTYALSQRTRASIAEAIEQGRAATALEPESAAAWAMLGHAYLLQAGYGFAAALDNEKPAREALDRALALNPRVVEAQVSRALVAENVEFDFATAQRHYRLALEVNPRHATALEYYGEMLVLAGQTGEGIRRLEQARAIDPTSAIIAKDLALGYLVASDYPQALVHARRSRELSPGCRACGDVAAWVNIYARTQGHAMPSPQDVRQATESTEDPALVACAGEALGDATLIARGRAGMLADPAHFAPLGWLCLKEHSKALDLLETGYAMRNSFLTSLPHAAYWKPLRSHPRFQALLGKIRFQVSAPF